MKVKVGALQLSYHSKDELFALLKKYYKRAAGSGVRFIVLPELFNTIYFPHEKKKEYFNLSETETGETISFIKQLSLENSINSIASIFEKDGNAYYLTAFVVDKEGEIAGKYRKTHLPAFKGAEESYYFEAGQDTPVFELDGLKFSILLCYDRHFPELSRVYALQGAEVIFLASATGTGASEIFLPQGRMLAFMNNVYICCANRTGFQPEGRIQFLGRSYIASSFGKFIAMEETQEGLITAEIDTEEVETARKTFNFYNARRPELYSAISKK